MMTSERRQSDIKLHLRVHDLSHPGALRFFSTGENPHALLAAALANIFRILYPTSLHIPPVRSITLYLEDFDGVALWIHAASLCVQS